MHIDCCGNSQAGGGGLVTCGAWPGCQRAQPRRAPGELTKAGLTSCAANRETRRQVQQLTAASATAAATAAAAAAATARRAGCGRYRNGRRQHWGRAMLFGSVMSHTRARCCSVHTNRRHSQTMQQETGTRPSEKRDGTNSASGGSNVIFSPTTSSSWRQLQLRRTMASCAPTSIPRCKKSCDYDHAIGKVSKSMAAASRLQFGCSTSSRQAGASQHW